MIVKIENLEPIDGFVYKQQVDIIIRQLVELSGLSDFEHLRKHYTRPISAGVARVVAEEKKLLQNIYVLN